MMVVQLQRQGSVPHKNVQTEGASTVETIPTTDKSLAFRHLNSKMGPCLVLRAFLEERHEREAFSVCRSMSATMNPAMAPPFRDSLEKRFKIAGEI